MALSQLQYLSPHPACIPPKLNKKIIQKKKQKNPMWCCGFKQQLKMKLPHILGRDDGPVVPHPKDICQSLKWVGRIEGEQN